MVVTIQLRVIFSFLFSRGYFCEPLSVNINSSAEVLLFARCEFQLQLNSNRNSIVYLIIRILNFNLTLGIFQTDNARTVMTRKSLKNIICQILNCIGTKQLKYSYTHTQ